jgi:hypothetical protein
MAGAMHAPPQETTPPQPSATDPQFIPTGQLVIGVQGGAPQTFWVPVPPHTWPLGQVLPQSRIPPHPLESLPQFAPAVAQVSGTHRPPSLLVPPPHTLDVPPPQVCGAVHGLQFAVTPSQPSACGPQRPGKFAHVLGVHVPPSGWLPPHLLGPPPPQKSGALQVPHDSMPPHPSLCCPQLTPFAW